MSKANPRYKRKNSALPVPTGNVWRLKIRGRLEGQITICDFYYMDEDTTKTPTDSAANDLMDAFTTGTTSVWQTFVAACSADWVSEGLICECPTSKTWATLERAIVDVGGGPGLHLPTTVAAVIQKHTQYKGQCGRGHISVPAVPKAWATASELTTLTAYGPLSIHMADVLTQAGHTYSPVVYSKGSWYDPKVGAGGITFCAIKTLLGTVRRRLLGRGK